MYFWPLPLGKQLLTHIKGARRRAALAALIDVGQLDQIPDFLAKAKLSDAERTAIGQVNPQFMGGEYLPDMTANEVEIAGIEIASTAGDVTSMYARRDGALIHYRVVDEYDGDTLSGQAERTSEQPLTLDELAEFFLGAWSLLSVLDRNFEGEVDQMLEFFWARSEYYPDFDRLLRQRVFQAFPARAEEADD